MQHVELFGAAAHHFHQQHVRRDAVANARVQTQRARPDRFELRVGDCESPLANSVTSWPSSTSASVIYDTTRSVPPYSLGGTDSVKGAICAIFILSVSMI